MFRSRNHFSCTVYAAALLLVYLLFMDSDNLSAQVYTLDECLEIALQNNKQIANDELSIVSAKYRVAESKSALLPHVDLQTQYQYYLNLPEQYAPASAFGGPEGEYSRLSLNMPQTLNTGIQITQPVFNKELKARVEASKLAQDALIIQSELGKESVKYNVTATYYSIQVLEDNLQRLNVNILNLERTVEINAVLKDNGLIAENAHHRLLINLDNLRNEKETQQLNLDKNLTLLKYLMQMDIQDTLQVASFDYNAIITDMQVADLRMRADIRFQYAQIDLATQDLKLVQARYQPSISATFGTGFTGYNNTFAPYQRINNDWINGSYFTLNAKVPLYAGSQKKFQLAQQKITIERQYNSLSMLELNARKEVMDASMKLRSSKTQLINTNNSLERAEDLFNTAQNDYANGIITLSDLLNAQNDLSDARTNYSSALLNVKLAELSLQKANGLL